MPKVLHIAAHYGGGVCQVTKNLPGDFVCLNKDPRNKEPLFDVEMIPAYDTVLVHVWNHPALFDFLVNVELPPCRLIGWSHMSGLWAPNILFKKLINYFDEFYFTSPISNQTGIQCETIWSARDLTEYFNTKWEPQGIAGYTGTVDFGKMHPDFGKITKQFDYDEILVIGEGKDLVNLNYPHLNCIGWQKDLKSFFSRFDALIYPLYEKHFGTCEQILGEALAVGTPCYVLDNPCESYIMSQCAEKRGDLWYPIEEKVRELYSEKCMLEKWNRVFERKGQKTKRSWHGHHVFLESLGEYARVFKDHMRIEQEIKDMFKEPQWKTLAKGSVLQYLDYFPDDHYLKQWSKLL